MSCDEAGVASTCCREAEPVQAHIAPRNNLTCNTCLINPTTNHLRANDLKYGKQAGQNRACWKTPFKNHDRWRLPRYQGKIYTNSNLKYHRYQRPVKVTLFPSTSRSLTISNTYQAWRLESSHCLLWESSLICG